MREKLLDLMKNEGLKPSQLAELLEINPAGVSHILAGRNKPGFDLLQKILRRFPRINPDWLMLDSPQMYRTEGGATVTAGARASESSSTSAGSAMPSAAGLFGSIQQEGSTLGDTSASYSAHPTTGSAPSGNNATSAIAAGPFVAKSGVAVRRVVICYDDDTFESYSPAR